MTVKVNVCRCPGCGDDIYSRAPHDFRVCTCGAIFVDGGFELLRYGFLVDRKPEWSDIYVHELEINADKDILFDDYNTGTDRFGKITVGGRYENWVKSKEDANGERTQER